MMGDRKIPRLAMKFNRLAAPVMIFQGTMTHPPMMVATTAERRRLRYLGNKDDISLLTEITLADTLTPICATTQARPQ